MDDQLRAKIKEIAKEFSKQTSYRGSILDDRLRPLRETCFEEGARQMYELLRSRLGNWVDEKIVYTSIEVAGGEIASLPLPESWINKEDGQPKLPKMGFMIPGSGLTPPDWETSGYTKITLPLVVEGEDGDKNKIKGITFPVILDNSIKDGTIIMKSGTIPLDINKKMRDMLVNAGCDIENNGNEEIITTNAGLAFRYAKK